MQRTSTARWRAGGRIESYGGADVWLQHGGQLGPVSVAAYLRMARTDGPDEIIRADQQTRLDQSSGSQTSLAPGPMTHPERQLQGQLDLQLQDWRWRLGYRQNYHQKINLGINEVLDPDADIAATQFNSDLNWLNRSLLPGAELSMGLQYSQRRVNTNPLHLLQNGYSVYPQGMLVSANRNEQVYGIDAGVLLESWQRHRLTLGAGFQHEAISDIAAWPGAPAGYCRQFPAATSARCTATANRRRSAAVQPAHKPAPAVSTPANPNCRCEQTR
jgi:iron complex outermembrane receptor protein